MRLTPLRSVILALLLAIATPSCAGSTRNRQQTDPTKAGTSAGVGETTESGQDIIRRGYEAFARRDISAVMSVFDESIVFHVPGRSAQSGMFSGKAEVGSYFSKVHQLSGGTHRVEVKDLLANQERVAALVRATAQRNGRMFDMDVVHLWRLQNGKATELWILPTDQYGFDEFWT